jgi:hypothetical protein
MMWVVIVEAAPFPDQASEISWQSRYAAAIRCSFQARSLLGALCGASWQLSYSNTLFGWAFRLHV